MILTTVSNSYTTRPSSVEQVEPEDFVNTLAEVTKAVEKVPGGKMLSLDGIPETGPVEWQRYGGYHFQKGCAAFKSEPHYSVS